MRPSNRTAILQAAVAVIEADGITAVTFDSVAAAANLTRGGIIYHFPSRDELIAALHEHLASLWEEQLVRACGKPASEATPTERLAAYVRVAAHAASRSELQMLISSHDTDDFEPWRQVLADWTPLHAELRKDAAGHAMSIALLAADGLWVSDAISHQPLCSTDREDLVDSIIRDLLGG